MMRNTGLQLYFRSFRRKLHFF